MFDYLYEWIQNMAFYLVIVTALLQVLPGKEYKKYVQFFSGMVMILLMLTPLLKLTGIEKQFYELYHNREYEMEREEIERQKDYFEDFDILDFLPEKYTQEKQKSEEGQRNIEVEEIQVGQ